MTVSGAPNTRRRAETRRRLMAAAYPVFIEHGIADAPIELICEGAGFTRGAFYSNFASKEDLFLAVFGEQMRDRLATVRAAFDELVGDRTVRDEATVRELVSTITSGYLHSLSDGNWYALTVEVRSMALRDPQLRQLTEAAFSQLFDELATMLIAMCDQVGMALTVAPRHAAVVLCTLYESALERAMFEDVESPFESPLISEVLPQLVARALFVPADADNVARADGEG